MASVVEKVMALVRLAADPGAARGEAANAAIQACRLVVEHRLEFSGSAKSAASVESEVRTEHRRPSWTPDGAPFSQVWIDAMEEFFRQAGRAEPDQDYASRRSQHRDDRPRAAASSARTRWTPVEERWGLILTIQNHNLHLEAEGSVRLPQDVDQFVVARWRAFGEALRAEGLGMITEQVLRNIAARFQAALNADAHSEFVDDVRFDVRAAWPFGFGDPGWGNFRR